MYNNIVHYLFTVKVTITGREEGGIAPPEVFRQVCKSPAFLYMIELEGLHADTYCCIVEEMPILHLCIQVHVYWI